MITCFASQKHFTLGRQSAFRFDCERYCFTRGEVDRSKFAFTLAEVLITLGIIGVVASITMPAIISNIQKTVLKHQFKTAYSKISNAVFLTQTNMDMPVMCSYWISGQNSCQTICTQTNDEGKCIATTCADGSPLPTNLNGPMSDCGAFYNELFFKTLQVAKYCPNKALANGCVTDTHHGIDYLSPGNGFNDNNIKNNYAVWVLTDGTIIIKYGSLGAQAPLFALDTNGQKGPNKWGYDIYSFKLTGDFEGIKQLEFFSTVEEGGTPAKDLLLN